MTATTEKPRTRRFRLLMGHHVENNPEGKEVRYQQGAEFDSVYDLLLYNGPAAGRFSPKFEEVRYGFPDQREGVPTPYAPASVASRLAITNLSEMNLRQLQDIAAEEEIDIKGSRDKGEILKLFGRIVSGELEAKASEAGMTVGPVPTAPHAVITPTATRPQPTQRDGGNGKDAGVKHA